MYACLQFPNYIIGKGRAFMGSGLVVQGYRRDQVLEVCLNQPRVESGSERVQLGQ